MAICKDCIHEDVCLLHEDNFMDSANKNGFCGKFKNKADVVKVNHGKWILMGTEMFMDGSYSSKFCCSLCSREIGVCHEYESDKYKYAKAMYPYCHCGAKMDGKPQKEV